MKEVNENKFKGKQCGTKELCLVSNLTISLKLPLREARVTEL